MSEIVFIGDVHGHVDRYLKIIDEVDERRTLQLGDMGIGFRGVDLPELDERHKFIRGNHDDPKLCREHPNYYADFGYESETGIFFLGGAYSVDYEWRQQRMEVRPGEALWWQDEELSEEHLELALKMYVHYKPRIVATHECPENFIRYALPPLVGEPKLSCANSRTAKALQRMLNHHAPDLWIFGRYHYSIDRTEGGTRFVCVPDLGTLVVNLGETT